MLDARRQSDSVLWNHSRSSLRLSVRHQIFSRLDHWPWYLVTDNARFSKKELAARILVQWPQIRPKMRFYTIFLNFGSYIFLQLAYNDSLRQYLTSSRGKSRKKFFWPNLDQISKTWARNEVFRHFLKFSSLVFL